MPGDTNVHNFVSAQADGADATVVRPQSGWNAQHLDGQLMTNQSGGSIAAGTVCVVSGANDNSVVTTTTQADGRLVMVYTGFFQSGGAWNQGSLANATEGLFKYQGSMTVSVQGAVTRGNYLRVSATAGALEDTGVAYATPGAVAVALTGAAGPGLGSLTALLFPAPGGIGVGAVTGDIKLRGTTTIPLGWLACDGTSYTTASQPNLFAVIGYTFGGAGANFNVPDLRGRVPVGAGQGTGLTNRPIGSSGGEETHTLTNAEVPATPLNNIGLVASISGLTGGAILAGSVSFFGGAAGTVNGGGGGHNNMQPFQACQYIIKT